MLVVVSNRLAASYRKVGAGYHLQATPGGLAVGFDSLRRHGDVMWVGWPGQVPPARQAEVESRLRTDLGSAPVFLPDALVRDFYEGFCNRTLWPLFHSMPMEARYEASQWAAYKRANALFADKVVEVAPDSGTIWIQDYQLLLLPSFLRERLPNARIGFFLHIPFPTYDILRLLPWHREVLEGLTGADLVGFHTYDYAQAYLTCLRRLLGIDNTLGEVVAGGRAFQVDVFPMGIDFKRYAGAGDLPGVQANEKRLRDRLGARKLTFSLCRLDYTKGVSQMLDAIELFLEERPEWHAKFEHVMVVVPSRERVGGYKELKREIDERVGRLNGRFGTVDWTPLRYIYRYLPFEELAALYSTADAALITPVRDGMNLVAKEFLAARRDLQGVLVLSGMAGAARELTGAIVVNPNSAEEVAGAIHAALQMPAAERRRRAEPMRERLESNDVDAWAERFLTKLEAAAERSKVLASRVLSPAARQEMVDRFARAARPMLLLDYDGTLVPFALDPAAAAPEADAKEALAALAGRPQVTLVILSGRDRASLERMVGDVPATLVAEHGAWMRARGSSEWQALVRADTAWKRQVKDVMRLFEQRIPGSSIEEKDFSLVWHWRGADRHVGTEASRELVEALTTITANTELVVLAGHRIVEVKGTAAGKGPFYVSKVAPRNPDFVLAMGDDATDETLFRVLPPDAFSVRVGFAVSAARFNVGGVDEVWRILEDLAAARRPESRPVPPAA